MHKPSMRAAVFQPGSDETATGSGLLILFVMHHVCTDGLTFELVRQELARVYIAVAAGESLPVLNSRIEYADFAWWQRGIVA